MVHLADKKFLLCIDTLFNWCICSNWYAFLYIKYEEPCIVIQYSKIGPTLPSARVSLKVTRINVDRQKSGKSLVCHIIMKSNNHMYPYKLETQELWPFWHCIIIFQNDRRVHRYILYQNFRMFPLVLWTPPPLTGGRVLLYLQSPKGGCCSISDDLSCSCMHHNSLNNINISLS